MVAGRTRHASVVEQTQVDQLGRSVRADGRIAPTSYAGKSAAMSASLANRS